MEEPEEDYGDDDFDVEGAGRMNPDDAMAARIELAQNEQEMAARKRLRGSRPPEVRAPDVSRVVGWLHGFPMGSLSLSSPRAI